MLEIEFVRTPPPLVSALYNVYYVMHSGGAAADVSWMRLKAYVKVGGDVVCAYIHGVQLVVKLSEYLGSKCTGTVTYYKVLENKNALWLKSGEAAKVLETSKELTYYLTYFHDEKYGIFIEHIPATSQHRDR